MSGKAEDAGAENMQSENMRQDDMRAENVGLESGAAAKRAGGVSVAGVNAACGGSNAKPAAENARAESDISAKKAAAKNAAAESNAGAGEDAESAAGPAAEPDSVSGVSGRSPRLRFAGFTEPWQTKKLCDVAEVTMGQSPKGSTYSKTPSDYILVQGNADMKDGWVYPRVWTTQKTKTACVGDLIMSVRAPVGAVGRTAYDVVLGRGVAGIKGNDFLYHLLSKADSEGYWSKYSAGTTFESINSNVLINAEFMMPSVGEQRQIGMFFSGLDRIISVQERKTEALRQAKKYFLQNMFPRRGESAPRLRVHGFTQPWQTRKLEDFGSSYGGLSGKNKDDFGHGDASFVTYKNVFLNPVADLDNVGSVEIDLSQNEVRYGDVFFTVSSEIPEEVGMSSVWVGKSENVYLNSFCFGYRPDDESVDPFFMAYMLRSDEVRRKLIFLAQGISRYNISKKAVLKIEVKLPSMEEQRLVGRFFSGLDRIIRVQERKTEALRQAKKYYLQNMFA